MIPNKEQCRECVIVHALDVLKAQIESRVTDLYTNWSSEDLDGMGFLFWKWSDKSIEVQALRIAQPTNGQFLFKAFQKADEIAIKYGADKIIVSASGPSMPKLLEKRGYEVFEKKQYQGEEVYMKKDFIHV